MIAPDVRIEDVDPDGFAHLCALAARRDRAMRSELQILHAGGRVLRAIDTRAGATADHREPFDDPQSRADELYRQTGYDRVTLVDAERIGEMAAAVDALATPATTQPELLWSANGLYWAHPAVATAPEPPRSAWPAVARALASLPDGIVVLGVYKGDDIFLGLAGMLRDGAFVRITSVEAADLPRPPRRRAAELLEAEGVVAGLVCDRSVFDEILLADDVLAALHAASAGRLLGARGLEAFDQNAPRPETLQAMAQPDDLRP